MAKQASAAALAILAGGKYFRTDVYSITLTSGAITYLTAGELPISVAIYPSSTKNTYNPGYTIIRGETTQSVGMDAQEMEITFAPQADYLGGPPTVAGFPIIQAARLGLLDNATVAFSKLFLNLPAVGYQLDTSPGGIGWLTGIVSEIEAQRSALKIKISSNLITLNQVQMPKDLYQPTCTHSVYDPGCTLSKSSFAVSGTVGTVTSETQFNTSLTQANDYFDLGFLKFTSGLNSGYQGTVKLYLNLGGNIQLQTPMPNTISNGDAFTINPGCDRTLATCTAKFSNSAHFKGAPFVPVPETLYDGGTSTPTGSSIGNLPIGSGPSGRTLPR